MFQKVKFQLTPNINDVAAAICYTHIHTEISPCSKTKQFSLMASFNFDSA